MGTAPEKAAYSVNDFISAYSVSRFTFYQEVKAGRIKIRKFGKRTLIARADAEAWFNALPEARAA